MTRSTARVLLLLLIGLGLGPAACDTGPRPPAGVGLDPVRASQYPAITIDGPLQKFVVADYDKLYANPPGPDRTLFIQVPLRNQADNDVALQYNVTWFATDGKVLGETGFQTVELPSRRQIVVSANATSREATGWRMDVRSAR